MGLSNRWHDTVPITVFIALLPGWCQGEEGKPSIADIERVWKARQDKVASALFELETEKTIPKGSVSVVANPEREAAGLPALPDNPPRDYIVKGTRHFSLSGGKTRDSYEDESWDPIGNRLYPKRYVEVFNGQRFKSLDEPSSGQENYPAGIVKKAPQSGSALKFPLLPIIFTVRGSHPDFFRDLGKFQVAAHNVPVAGRPCLELVRVAERGDGREVLYLDQERDYVVVKFMIVEGDHPKWQLDATYSPDQAVGWVPKSWEYVIRTGGKDRHILSSQRRSVVRYEINPNLDDEEFDIRFPPGTKVDDDSSGRYVVYAIGENGEKGREVPANAGATYEELLKTPTRPHRWVLFWGWGSILLLALGTLAVLWLRRRRRNAQVPQ
jgi:hypothetical protein